MKKPILLINVLLVLLALAGCLPIPDLNPKGNLKVVVEIPAQLQSMMADAKLATAGFDISTMKIKLTQGANAQEQTLNLTAGQSTAEATFTALPVGAWTVNVQVFDNQNHLIYTGTGTGNVSLNITTNVSVVLIPNDGGLEVQVVFPDNVGITNGEIKLTHSLNNANLPQEVVGNLSMTGNLGTVKFNDLYPTSWQMYVTLRNAAGEVVVEGDDTVEILPGRDIAVAIELTLDGDLLINLIWDVPPAKPTGLSYEVLENGAVKLSWAANTEPNIVGYRLYHSMSESGAKHLLNIDLLTNTEYIDTTAQEGMNYYWVRAIVTTGLASVLSDPLAVLNSGELEYGSLEGHVVFSDQTDHSGINVSCAGLTTQTNSDGFFYFQTIPEGENILTAEAEGYYANNAIVNIIPNTINQSTELVMYPLEANGSVSGYAKYLDGTDHSGIAIEIRTLNGQQLPDLIAVTDSNGYFIFPQVPVDSVTNTATYIFTAFKLNDPAGYSSDSQQVTITGNTHTNIETEFVLRYAAVEVMIFADDVNPWDSSALTEMLGQINVSYEIFNSAAMANITLPLNKIVWIVNDQPQTFYDAYSLNQSKFDDFVYNGGTLLFEACDEGWNSGSILGAGATLPGGVQNNLYYCSYNTVVNPTHPMMTGIPIALQGSYASHNWFSNLPADHTVLTVDDQNNPTLVEYRYNLGRVIATGQPLEFHWANDQNPKGIYPNMIYYTFDKAIETPVQLQSEMTTFSLDHTLIRTSGN